VNDPQGKSEPIKWPGAVLCLGFLTWLLFMIWTLKGELPWQ